MKTSSRCPGRAPAMGSERRPSPECAATGETRRKQSLPKRHKAGALLLDSVLRDHLTVIRIGSTLRNRMVFLTACLPLPDLL
jgi:hypothetical protein